MVSITLSVPEELKKDMDIFPKMNWSAIAREGIKDKVKELQLIRDFKKKTNPTKKDAIILGKKLNKNL